MGVRCEKIEDRTEERKNDGERGIWREWVCIERERERESVCEEKA